MPSYQMEAIFLRIGLALAAGVLIASPPIALRRARYEPSIPKRIFFHLFALVALVGFCFYANYLWSRFIPKAPETPVPVAYPAAPVAPVAAPAAP